MLSRKQRWRRVRCRPRQSPAVGKASDDALETAGGGGPDDKNKPSDLVDLDSDDSDDVSTINSSVISTWSSFDSLEEHEEADEQDTDSESEGEPGGRDEGGVNGEGKTADARANRGVTFEPRVQVFLVTHKSELDNR